MRSGIGGALLFIWLLGFAGCSSEPEDSPQQKADDEANTSVDETANTGENPARVDIRLLAAGAPGNYSSLHV